MPKQELMDRIAGALSQSTIAGAVIANNSSLVNELPRPQHVPAPMLQGVTLTFAGGPQSPYFGFGKQVLDHTKAFSATCEVLSCATATLLARPGTGLLRKEGVLIELVGYRDMVSTKQGPKPGKTGHVFLVVGRAPGSDFQHPATWGDGFAVDQWWASQKAQPNSPVKDPAAGSAYSDPAYFAFMAQRTLASYGELTT